MLSELLFRKGCFDMNRFEVTTKIGCLSVTYESDSYLYSENQSLSNLLKKEVFQVLVENFHNSVSNQHHLNKLVLYFSFHK